MFIFSIDHFSRLLILTDLPRRLAMFRS